MSSLHLEKEVINSLSGIRFTLRAVYFISITLTTWSEELLFAT